MLFGFWYRALPSDKLSRSQFIPTLLLEQPLVVGRDRQGKPFALRDACPHRGMPLSQGQFDGQKPECCYHGWKFEAHSGQCTLIPAWNIFRWVPFGAEWLKLVFAKFVEQDRRTMELQSEGLRHNPHLMLTDDADRPAKWVLRAEERDGGDEEERRRISPSHERTGEAEVEELKQQVSGLSSQFPVLSPNRLECECETVRRGKSWRVLLRTGN